MDNHHGGNVKMNNPDGKRLDFLFRSNYLSFCFRAAARHMRRLLSWVSWPLGLVRRWGDVGSSSSDDVMHTGSTELVKIVSKYLYLFLQIPLPSPQYRRSSRLWVVLIITSDWLTLTLLHSTQITHADLGSPARSGQRTVQLVSGQQREDTGP